MTTREFKADIDYDAAKSKAFFDLWCGVFALVQKMEEGEALPLPTICGQLRQVLGDANAVRLKAVKRWRADVGLAGANEARRTA
jgi:hypothetical protein